MALSGVLQRAQNNLETTAYTAAAAPEALVCGIEHCVAQSGPQRCSQRASKERCSFIKYGEGHVAGATYLQRPRSLSGALMQQRLTSSPKNMPTTVPLATKGTNCCACSKNASCQPSTKQLYRRMRGGGDVTS